MSARRKRKAKRQAKRADSFSDKMTKIKRLTTAFPRKQIILLVLTNLLLKNLHWWSLRKKLESSWLTKSEKISVLSDWAAFLALLFRSRRLSRSLTSLSNLHPKIFQFAKPRGYNLNFLTFFLSLFCFQALLLQTSTNRTYLSLYLSFSTISTYFALEKNYSNLN